MEKILVYILVKLRVLKSDGKYPNGRYITCGLNFKNPITYPILLVLIALSGIEGFFTYSIDTFKEAFQNN